MMEIVNKGKEECNHVSIDVQLESDSLLTTLQGKMDGLSPLPSKRSIYRVPKQLRLGNEKAFAPQVISIGPLHHNDQELKCMEEHKIRFLKEFLSRTNVTLGHCIQILKNKEAQLRNCYADTIEFDSDEFVEIILVDAAFIVELFLRCYFSELREEDDYIFHRPWKQWDIRYDLLLLENQLPFFIIQELLALAKAALPIENDVRLSAIILTHKFFSRTVHLMLAGKLDMERQLYHCDIKHFVDFVRSCHLPSKKAHKKRLESFTIPTATMLQQAGIRFNVGKDRHLFDITFQNGVLEIPRLLIYDSTENFLRNLIAYERCHFSFSENYFNDYVFLIDRLVESPGDVELLVHSGILESTLSGSQEVASFINKLNPGKLLVRGGFKYTGLCEDLCNYCKVPWHKWRATLKRDYFSTPWATISLIAAVVLLILTFIQTFFSVISYE